MEELEAAVERRKTACTTAVVRDEIRARISPEAMAKARTYQSEYAKTRRNELADKLLDQIARSTELAVSESDPRKFQALMQAADAATRAYSTITKADQAGHSGLKHGLSMLEKFAEAAATVADLLPPIRPGLIQD